MQTVDALFELLSEQHYLHATFTAARIQQPTQFSSILILLGVKSALYIAIFVVCALAVSCLFASLQVATLLTRVTNNASCNWVNLVQVRSI